MSWANVFGDMVQEVGFKYGGQNGPSPSQVWDVYDLEFGFETINPTGRVSEKSMKKVSAIMCRIHPSYVEVVWILPYTQYAYPTYSYPIPEYAVEAMARVHQLIDLAKHKLKTGETLPVPYVLP